MKLQKIIKELEERPPEWEIPLHYSEEKVIIALEMYAKSILQEVQDIKRAAKTGETHSKYSDTEITVAERLIDLSHWLRAIGNDLYRWTNRYTHGDFPGQLTKK